MNELKRFLPKLALGTWPISGAREWGSFDEKDAQKLLGALLENDITCLDCAAIYGLGGAENLLGKFFKTTPRSKFILTSKCGLLPSDRAVKFDLSAASLQKQIEDSLRRLNTDYLDIYFLHWPDKNTPLEETLTQMERFRKEGKIRFIGLSNFSEENSFCKQSIFVIFTACLIKSSVKLDKPIKRILPSFLNLSICVRVSLIGVFLSGQCRK